MEARLGDVMYYNVASVCVYGGGGGGDTICISSLDSKLLSYLPNYELILWTHEKEI